MNLSVVSNVGRSLFSGAVGVAFLSLALVGGSQQVHAQAAQGEEWYKACTKQDENDVCVVQKILSAPTGQLLTAVGLITVAGQVNRQVLQVTVPTARRIPSGVSMSIDGGQSSRLDFSVCMPDRCVAEVPLTEAVVNGFKRGREVVFTSVNFQGAPNPIPVSLNGFTGAFDGPALAQSELEERQRTLQEEMQRKADEARQKLEAAQNAAKEN